MSAISVPTNTAGLGVVLVSYNLAKAKIMPRGELRENLQNDSETVSVHLAHLISLNTENETTRDGLIHS